MLSTSSTDLQSLNLNYHFYADDTQIYIHTRPGQQVNVGHLSNCIVEIKIWMSNNFLSLNGSKTEVMLLGSPHQLRKVGSPTLSVDGVALEFKTKLRNLGVIFDATLSFEPFVQNTVKTSFYHLRNIARLRPMLSFSVAEKLINSFVFSRIDYCNGLLAGVSKSSLDKLQYLQNSAARVLSGVRARDHKPRSWSPCTGYLLGTVLILKSLCWPINLCTIWYLSI